MDIVYVDIGHMDFWWGVHGLADKTGWEDVYLFKKAGRHFEKIAAFCICTRPYLEKTLSEPDDDDAALEPYTHKVRTFLKNQKIAYFYAYDDPATGGFWEVPFNAPRNERGVKPNYIELWHPAGGIDIQIVTESVTAFCEEFFSVSIQEVIFKESVSLENALRSHAEVRQKGTPEKVVFTDELINRLAGKWGQSREKVLERLKRYLKH